MENNNTILVDKMWAEAVERMEIMEVCGEDIDKIKFSRRVNFKAVVNDEEKTIRKIPVTKKEQEMIKNMEEEYGFICYYLSMDRGMMPDGAEFDRYSLFYVSNYIKNFETIKEYLWGCQVVPVFVVNMAVPEYSEPAECRYKNFKGVIINIS